MKERRKQQRLRTYFGGRVSFNNRYTTMDCLVRNMSPGGAKLVFSSPVALPLEFDIHIRNRSESRRGRLIWCDELQYGVLLNGSDFASVVSIETALRIRKLQAEHDALEKRVAQLSEPLRC